MSLSVDLRHRFGDFALDVAFDAPAGVTAFSGPSGTGKTLVMRMIAGVLRADEGSIRLDDETLFDASAGVMVPPHKRRIGFVFQDARLFPHLSVARNLTYGQRYSGSTAPVEPITELLGISHLLDRKPSTLSGGETQRVAIGRALLSDPKLLIMDEPLAALDDARKAEILPYLERLRAHGGPPILYVSHAMEEIARLADHLVLMRDGKVVRQGGLQDLLSDAEAVRDLGPRAAGAVIDATLSKADAGDGLSMLETSAGVLYLPRREEPEGTQMRVRMRASDVMLSRDKPDRVSALNILKAEIVAVEVGHGPGVAVSLQSGTDRILARITRRSLRLMGLKPGMTCYAVIKSVSVAPADISRTRSGHN